MVSGMNPSGINTDQMIRQLMYIERQPLRNMEKDKKEVNNKIDAWQKINTSLDTLKNKTEDIEGIFDEMSTSSNDEGIATASADPSATTGDYNINIDQLAKSHRVRSDDNLAADYTLDNDGQFEVSVDGKSSAVNVNAGDSLNDVANAINNQAVDGDGNQLAEATVVDNQLVIEGSKTGNANALSLKDTTNKPLENLGVIDNNDVIQHQIQGAQDAQFDLNGITDITSSSNTVDDVVNGMSFNLKDTGSTTITVNNNSEAMKEKIQSFVDQYNSVQDKFEKYGGKESVLQGDSSLRGLESNLYGSAINPVEGLGLDKNTLSLVGIDVNNDGSLSVNDSELEENLNNNLSEVKQLFLGNESNPDKGIANRIKNEVEMATDTFDGYVSGKIDSLESQVDWIEEDMTNLERRLELREERLNQKFSRMERSISQMQNQQSWLSSQL